MSIEIGKLTRLPLGYSGESGTRKIQIDMTAWMKAFVGAVIVVYALRPDRYPYFPAIEMQDNTLTWEVDAAEVSIPGKGWAQIAAVDPKTGKEYHSRVVQTEVYKSLEEFQGATASEPAQKWVLQVLKARDEATEAADRAVKAANRAENAAGGGTTGGTTETVIPSYWQSHLETRAEDIRAAMAAAGWNKSAFFFYSDAHWDNNNQMSPVLLKWLYQNTPINKTNFGGDVVNAEEDLASTMDYLWEWRSAIRDLPNHHSVPGNHDDGNNPYNRWTAEDVYTFLLAPEESNDMMRGEGLYYYIDVNAEKTRYLYLDSATAFGSIAWNDAQKTWLKEALLSVPDGYHIVVIAHIWADPDYSVTPPTAGVLGENARYMLEVFDQYNAREGDFESCGGRVEFCVGGHNHQDSDYSSTDGIPVILVETDSKHVRSGLECTKGTITENSVNAIVADYTNGIVNVIRIGRGSSRIVKLDGSGSEELPDDDNPGEDEDTTWKDVTLTRVKQTSDDTVALEWSANVDGVTYVVFDNGVEVSSKTDNTQIVLFDVTAGDHSYTVRPQKSEENLGNMSGALSITTVDAVGFTNVLRIATKEDGTLCNNGYGYEENIRYSSSAGGDVYCEGWDRSGIFPAKAGDVVRFYNMDFLDVDGSGGEWPRNSINAYNEDYSHITSISGEELDASGDTTWALVRDTDNDIIQFTMISGWNSVSLGNTVAKLRVSARNIDAFSIITVNEEIHT